MDMSWLGNIFGSLLHVFSPLKSIAHWEIWLEMKNWYSRFKKWRDWYRDHVLAPFKQQQQAIAKIRDRFIKPVILLIDHVRQLSQVIGIFNKKLAAKLDFQFLKVESYLLKPFNDALNRIGGLGRAIQGFITPLGYFDRGTLLNSLWRDAGLVTEILHNPFEQHPPAATLPPQPTISDRIGWTEQYLNSDAGPYAPDVDKMLVNYQLFKGEA